MQHGKLKKRKIKGKTAKEKGKKKKIIIIKGKTAKEKGGKK